MILKFIKQFRKVMPQFAVQGNKMTIDNFNMNIKELL